MGRNFSRKGAEAQRSESLPFLSKNLVTLRLCGRYSEIWFSFAALVALPFVLNSHTD